MQVMSYLDWQGNPDGSSTVSHSRSEGVHIACLQCMHSIRRRTSSLASRLRLRSGTSIYHYAEEWLPRTCTMIWCKAMLMIAQGKSWIAPRACQSGAPHFLQAAHPYLALRTRPITPSVSTQDPQHSA